MAENRLGNMGPEDSFGRKMKRAIFTMAAGAALYAVGHSYFAPDTVITVINGSEPRRNPGGDNIDYRVFTSDGIFVNKEAYHRLKFQTGVDNVHARTLDLKGEPVLLRKYGWDLSGIGVSLRENIIEVETFELPKARPHRQDYETRERSAESRAERSEGSGNDKEGLSDRVKNSSEGRNPDASPADN